jgi:uncharacterized membrane protein YgaE (UPF0421/DUF939 family)
VPTAIGGRAMTRWPEARSRIEQAQGRLRQLGWRESLSIERDVVRRILKSTLAATASWLAAELLGSQRPVLAALAAIIVVQVTVRSSLARSIQLTVAVTLGLAGSVLIGHAIGQHWWSIGLIVLIGLVLGELFRLGALSGQVAISAMLALSLGTGYGLQRALDTALGAIIGVAVSMLIVPASYVSEAGRTLRALGEDLGALLSDMGNGIPTGPTPDTVRRWLSRARDLNADSRAAIATVKQGEESLQFNPRAKRELDQLARLTEARRALDHAINQTRGIARSLLELPTTANSPDMSAATRALGTLTNKAAQAASAFGRLQDDPLRQRDRTLLEEISLVSTSSAGDAIRGLETAPSERNDQAAASMLLISIYVDLERILKEFDIVSGEHRAAVSLDESS